MGRKASHGAAGTGGGSFQAVLPDSREGSN